MYRSPFSTARTPTRDPSRPSPGIPDAGWRAAWTRRRTLLLMGSALLLAAPLALFEPGAHWADDPELFRLLRGMAGLKGVMVIIAFTAVWWRLGRGLTPRLASTYVGGVWAVALATGLIWQLTAVPAASALFHGAIIALLVAAWRDIERPNRLPPAGRSSATLNPTTGGTPPPASSRRPRRSAPR